MYIACKGRSWPAGPIMPKALWAASVTPQAEYYMLIAKVLICHVHICGEKKFSLLFIFSFQKVFVIQKPFIHLYRQNASDKPGRRTDASETEELGWNRGHWHVAVSCSRLVVRTIPNVLSVMRMRTIRFRIRTLAMAAPPNFLKYTCPVWVWKWQHIRPVVRFIV